MAFNAGDLNYRYKLQASSESSRYDSGEPVIAWTTEATFWGSRKADAMPDERHEADTVFPYATELLELRYRGGVTTAKRVVRLRDASTLAAGINASTTTVTLAAALKFSGGSVDYLEVDSELMRVTAGGSTTTLTVERGAAGTTAASHSNGATATRAEICHIVAIARADEREDELVLRVARND